MFVDVVQQYVVDFQYPKKFIIKIFEKKINENLLLDYVLLNVLFDMKDFQFQLQVELEYFQTK